MALRQAARQLLGNRCLSVVTSANGGALQARARAPPWQPPTFARGLRACARALRPPLTPPRLPAQSRLVGQLRPFNATAAARGGAGLPVERGPPVSQEARARASRAHPGCPAERPRRGLARV